MRSSLSRVVTWPAATRVLSRNKRENPVNELILFMRWILKTKGYDVIGINVCLSKLMRFLRKNGVTGAPYTTCKERSRVWYLIYLKVKSKRSCSGRLGQLGRQVGASAGLSTQEGLRMSLFSRGYSESLYVSGKLPTYPSPKPTLTLTSHLGQNVALREG